jgi:hypothetical protein
VNTGGWRASTGVITLLLVASTAPATITTTVQLNGRDAPRGTQVGVYLSGTTRDPVASGDPDQPLQVPPGKYDVRATIPGGPIAGVEVWHPDVVVGAGQDVSVTLSAVQKRGSLQVRVFMGRDELKGASVLLLPSGAWDERGLVMTEGEPLPLTAGRYKLLARIETPVGRLETTRDDVEVKAEQQTDVRLEIPLGGYLTVDVKGRSEEDNLLVGFAPPGSDEVVAEINAFAECLLPAGTYDLLVEDGAAVPPRQRWKRGVRVTAGQKSIVTVPSP